MTVWHNSLDIRKWIACAYIYILLLSANNKSFSATGVWSSFAEIRSTRSWTSCCMQTIPPPQPLILALWAGVPFLSLLAFGSKWFNGMQWSRAPYTDTTNKNLTIPLEIWAYFFVFPFSKAKRIREDDQRTPRSKIVFSSSEDVFYVVIVVSYLAGGHSIS